MTVILFIVSIYNAGVGILWGKTARDRAIQIHADAMAEKDAATGEKLARPFLHPRITGLEAGEGEYRNGSYNNASRSDPTDYESAYPTSNGYQHGYPSQDGYNPDGNHPPPVSQLYLPTPSSPSQEAQAIHPPFASDPSRESGSISDRTVVADPQSNASSSSLNGPKKGIKGFFSRK